MSACSFAGFLRGLPLLPLTGWIESINSSRAFESCRLALVSNTVSGTPLASVTRCRFEPGRPRSRGLGPVFSPPLFAGMLAESRPALDQSVKSALPRWSSRMWCIRHHTPAFCQSRETTPASRAAATPDLLRQHPPGDAALEYVEDACEHVSVRYPRSAAFLPGWVRRQEWLDDLPQFVAH